MRYKVGDRVGNVVLLEIQPNSGGLWLVECVKCGKRKLKKPNRKAPNCNCEQGEKIRKAKTIHGMCDTIEYKSWGHMMERCFNPNCDDYPEWGGRGITVCERWRTFKNFINDMGMKPGPEYKIERIDNDGNYEPGNCKWATQKEQGRNQRSNVVLNIGGVKKIMVEWSEMVDVPYKTITQRKRAGWQDWECVMPVGYKRKSKKKKQA